MIQYIKGDILKAQTEALVNTVNCVGVMGSGIALQFKRAFPANFQAYVAACRRGDVQPGRMFVFDTGLLTNPRYIINFPTKRHWRGKSRIEDIEAGLAALVEEIRSRNIRSIAIPPLGSGLGGLDWADVRPRIERVLEPLADVEVLLLEPVSNYVRTDRSSSNNVPRMTAGRAALVSFMNRYIGRCSNAAITLQEIHALMYFLQAAGEPLNLKYVKASYGPYAQNLGRVLRKIEGHLTAGYANGVEAPSKTLQLLPGAVLDAEAFLAIQAATRERLERVMHLVEGCEGSQELELLACVHWAVSREGAKELTDVVRCVCNPTQPESRFSPAEIGRAMQRLHSQGWFA